MLVGIEFVEFIPFSTERTTAEIVYDNIIVIFFDSKVSHNYASSFVFVEFPPRFEQ